MRFRSYVISSRFIQFSHYFSTLLSCANVCISLVSSVCSVFLKPSHPLPPSAIQVVEDLLCSGPHPLVHHQAGEEEGTQLLITMATWAAVVKEMITIVTSLKTVSGS